MHEHSGSLLCGSVVFTLMHVLVHYDRKSFDHQTQQEKKGMKREARHQRHAREREALLSGGPNGSRRNRDPRLDLPLPVGSAWANRVAHRRQTLAPGSAGIWTAAESHMPALQPE